MAENEAPQAQLQACAADDQREATELQPRPTPISEVEGQQDSTEPREAETPRSTDHLSCVRKYGFAITRFWTHQVFLSVSHDDCRDHFGKSWDILLFTCFRWILVHPVPLISGCFFRFDSICYL